MSEIDAILKLVSWIADRFGTAGLIVGYFIYKDWKLSRMAETKKEDGSWVDMKSLKDEVMDGISKVSADTGGFTKFGDRLLGLEEAQNKLLNDNLSHTIENSKSLERIERKLQT